MNRFLILFCLALYSVVGYAETIDVIKAKSIAEAFINTRKGTPEEVELRKRTSKDKEQQTPIRLFRTVELEANDPALYIFTGEHSFVIVSAEDDYGEILAYLDEDRFDRNGEVAPFASEMLEFYKQQIKQTRLNKKTSRTTIDFGSGKLLKTAKFGQDGFWRAECPKINGEWTLAGCVPTAMAIIMKYHNWPSSGTGAGIVEADGIPYTVDFSKQTYDWNAIPNESPDEVIWSDYAEKEIAKILFHAGVSVKTKYGTDESPTYIDMVGPALINYFKFKAYRPSEADDYCLWKGSYTEEEWMEMMKQEIDQNRPFIVSGISTTGGSSHCFVCDGYDMNGLFHYNLGWSGTSNGYYSLNSIDGRYDLLHAIIGIEPNEDWVPGPEPQRYIPAEGMHEYVDLGLPSGTLWAKTNIGAVKEEDFGDYFAWGETSTKSYYDWKTYKYYDASRYSITKYTDQCGTLEPSDDAATATWGEDWCMPTIDEVNELISSCRWKYLTYYGADGYWITGPNKKSIFLPAAGMMTRDNLTNQSQGRYWTSSRSATDEKSSSYLLFDSERPTQNKTDRSNGLSIRPVYAKKQVPVKVTSIHIVPSSVVIAKGKRTNLDLKVLPENATNQGIKWTSSKESIATVGALGDVKAIEVGICYIYASSVDGSNVFGTCKIEVVPNLVESITMNHTTYELKEGESLQLEATVLPEDAENKSLLWTSSDENVVTVTSSGQVTYVNSGSATVTATSTDGSGVSASCIFSVIQGILNITADDNIRVSVYSAEGKKIKQIQQGLNIITDDKGNTKKVVIQ